MTDDTTIFGDRETVELLAEQPELLAIADAVRATQREMAQAGTARLRLLVAAAVAVGLAVVSALALTGSFGGQRAPVAVGPARLPMHLPPVLRGHPLRLTAGCGRNRCAFYGYPMPDLFDYAITRADGAISSIAVTVRGMRLDSTAELQVHVGRTGPGPGRVVFSEHMSLSPIPSSIRPWGVLSEWSGTLSPSDWVGGCQDAVYWLTARIKNRVGWITLVQPPSFNCRSAVVGPTGSSSPTDG